MTDTKVHMCPVFPDLVCPQGLEMSKVCAIRMNGDFDPIADFRDHLLLHCAIFQTRQKKHSDNLNREEA